MDISDLVLKLLKAKRITFPFVALSFTLAIFNQFESYINHDQTLSTLLKIFCVVLLVVFLIFLGVAKLPSDQSSFTFGGFLVAISAIGILGKIIPEPTLIQQFNTFWFIGFGIWGLFEIDFGLILYGGSIST